MKPLEINTKIAQIKKLNWVESNKASLCDYYLKQTNLVPPKNWAEDIKDAWELFDEMISTDIVNISKVDGMWQVGGMTGWENEAPLAICKAWLVWKGQE